MNKGEANKKKNQFYLYIYSSSASCWEYLIPFDLIQCKIVHSNVQIVERVINQKQSFSSICLFFFSSISESGFSVFRYSVVTFWKTDQTISIRNISYILSSFLLTLAKLNYYYFIEGSLIRSQTTQTMTQNRKGWCYSMPFNWTTVCVCALWAMSCKFALLFPLSGRLSV